MVEVVLTSEQQERIRKHSGVTIETVVIPDATGVWAKTMPNAVPGDIEIIALEQARRKKAMEEADALLAAEMARMRASMTSHPEILDQMDRILAEAQSKRDKK